VISPIWTQVETTWVRTEVDVDTWGFSIRSLMSQGSDSFPSGTAVVTAHRYLLAPDAPGRRQQVPGVMVLLVDEPVRGDTFSPIREAQASGEE
jgi:hypothetical protein